MGMPMYTMQGIHVHTPGLCRVYPCLHAHAMLSQTREGCSPTHSSCGVRTACPAAPDTVGGGAALAVRAQMVLQFGAVDRLAAEDQTAHVATLFREAYRDQRPVVFTGLDLPAQVLFSNESQPCKCKGAERELFIGAMTF